MGLRNYENLHWKVFAFSLVLTGLTIFAYKPFIKGLNVTLSEYIQSKSINNDLDENIIIENKKFINENQTEAFDRLSALDDPDNRISKEFHIPKNLKYRTSFWFDVYTKYNKYQHIIHHSKYPWLVYEVVDISPFLKGKGATWYKIEKGLKFVKKRKADYRRALKKLSKGKNRGKLNKTEMNVVKTLKSIRGKRRSVYRDANQKLRVQLGQKEYFLGGLENSSKYLEQMESIFTEAGLPKELTRIPFVESSFNEKAQSKVGASGVWQLMPLTAKQYIKVNSRIDERNSPVKASHVAAKVFNRYFRYFKKWPLAITAYNNGIGNLNKAIKRSKSKNLGAIISRYQGNGAFKFASSNFYTSFLAALHAEIYHNEIFPDHKLNYHPPLNKVAVKLRHSLKPNSIAKKAGVKLETLLNYNLDLKHIIKKNRFVPKGHTILLPEDKVNSIKKEVIRTYFEQVNLNKRTSRSS